MERDIGYQKIVKLSPVISSENIGDQIIDFYCDRVLNELFPNHMEVSVPTREHLSTISARHITSADHAFVCGTNILCSDLRHNQQWNIGKMDAARIEFSKCKKKDFLTPWNAMKKRISSNILLLGVGWFQYEAEPDKYTAKIYRQIFSSKGIHPVRDSFTENRLRELGIENVVNTACPTMWGLTKEYCSKIPKKKANKVVTTLTNYHKDGSSDEMLLDILLRCYSDVYVWLQAIEDYAYLKSLNGFDRVHVIPPTLAAYREILRDHDIEYVGTRLHGGIYALNALKRALIIATDNRALEISKGTGSPVIKRDEMEEKLEDMIIDDRQTNIVLPEENIIMWKNQFNRIARGGYSVN